MVNKNHMDKNPGDCSEDCDRAHLQGVELKGRRVYYTPVVKPGGHLLSLGMVKGHDIWMKLNASRLWNVEDIV